MGEIAFLAGVGEEWGPVARSVGSLWELGASTEKEKKLNSAIHQ